MLVRRRARAEPELAGPLDALVDGYAAVAATARDLLDAGLEPVHAEAADEALAADGAVVASAAEVARARALVRTAADLAAAVEAAGVRRTSTLLRRATALLVAAPERALPARAVLVHGFADAPGVTVDLLEALLRHRGAEVVLDLPPDPAAGDGPDPLSGHPFTARFQERLAAAAPVERLEAPASGAAGRAGGTPLAVAAPLARSALSAFEASGADAEVRELAVRVRALLDDGARPEGVGVVVRDLDRYRLPLRRHFGVLGVPFSAVGGRGSLTAEGRRAAALRDLLRRRGELPTDRWLDAAPALYRGGEGGERSGSRARVAQGGDAGPLAVDLRLAFSALGAARLRDVAGLEIERYLRDGYYYLPVRQGLREAASGPADEPADADLDADGGELAMATDATDTVDAADAGQPADGADAAAVSSSADTADTTAAADATEVASELADPGRERRRRGSGALRRRVRGDHLRRATAAARALSRRLESWPQTAASGEHFDRLDALLDELGWRPAGEVRDAIGATRASIPPGFALTPDELHLLLDRALDGAGADDLGGRGGGVQVLSVVEARGLTFEHLFLPGLNRGVFPRTIRQDPLLSDELRGVLARVLPDVPIKQKGFDEERYLFAQLLASSPRVTLSWPLADLEGRPALPVAAWSSGCPAASASARAPTSDRLGRRRSPPCPPPPAHPAGLVRPPPPPSARPASTPCWPPSTAPATASVRSSPPPPARRAVA